MKEEHIFTPAGGMIKRNLTSEEWKSECDNMYIEVSKTKEYKMPITSIARFSRAYGQKSVIFRNDRGRESHPFQPYDEKDVESVRYYNKFSYESSRATYDIRVYTTGEMAYEKNGELGHKLPYHTAIEKHFKIQIAETISIFDKIPNNKQNEKGIV